MPMLHPPYLRHGVSGHEAGPALPLPPSFRWSCRRGGGLPSTPLLRASTPAPGGTNRHRYLELF